MDEFAAGSQIAHDAGADGIDMSSATAISAIRFCVLTTTASGVRRELGQPLPVRLTTLRAHSEGSQRSELHHRIQGVAVGGLPGRLRLCLARTLR